jgi:hypothetical protein
MPTSTWRGMEIFTEIVVKSNAKSFLDIGIGNGKWGFLFREYADVWAGRFSKIQWEATIDGVEIYKPYIQEYQKAIYTKIYINDVNEIINKLGNYDIIMAGDVIEHLKKHDAITLINKLKEKTKISLTASIPLGDEWLRKKFSDNEYEAHISSWSVADLRELGFHYYTINMAPDEKRQIGFFVYYKNEFMKIKNLKKLKKWSFLP